MRERAYTLITGGAGFVGSNLADALLTSGEKVVILDNLSRDDVEQNASWLLSKHGPDVRVEVGSVTDAARVQRLVRGANRVYHLAAQVAVTTSLRDPRLDLNSNLIGTLNVLEAAREMRDPPAVLFASTNKVYGEMGEVPISKTGDAYTYADRRPGISEDAPLDFHSPYGCSKGAADQYVRDYARSFGVPTVVFRMSCVYGERQFGTEDQGWVAHFARAILGGKPITIFGDGCQVRDVLWIGDLVEAMRKALENADDAPGEVFNIGGGEDNAVSLRRVIRRLEEITGSEVQLEMAGWRPGDQRIYVSDTSKAERLLDWRPSTTWETGLERLTDWLASLDKAGSLRQPRNGKRRPRSPQPVL
jgi:CDP-paratose 2-epimerase